MKGRPIESGRTLGRRSIEMPDGLGRAAGLRALPFRLPPIGLPPHWSAIPLVPWRLTVPNGR